MASLFAGGTGFGGWLGVWVGLSPASRLVISEAEAWQVRSQMGGPRLMGQSGWIFSWIDAANKAYLAILSFSFFASSSILLNTLKVISRKSRQGVSGPFSNSHSFLLILGAGWLMNWTGRYTNLVGVEITRLVHFWTATVSLKKEKGQDFHLFLDSLPKSYHS